MENKNQNKEPMNQMMIGMNQMPLNGMSNYQYYLSDYHPMQNYPPIHFYGNNQQMNGFPYHLQPPREEPTYPPNPGVKAQISSKSSSPNVQASEKPKMKSYINLLITSVNNLFKEGKISTKYLNEKTEHKATHQNINSLYSLNNINTNNISTINRNISETSSSNTGKKSSRNPDHEFKSRHRGLVPGIDRTADGLEPAGETGPPVKVQGFFARHQADGAGAFPKVPLPALLEPVRIRESLLEPLLVEVAEMEQV